MIIMSYVISAGIEGIYKYSHWKDTSILQIIIDWHCCSSITVRTVCIFSEKHKS